MGDKCELAAICAVFGDASPVAITSISSSTGHQLGPTSGIEVIFTVLTLRDQVVPPTLNLHHPDLAAENLNVVAQQARQMPIKSPSTREARSSFFTAAVH